MSKRNNNINSRVHKFETGTEGLETGGIGAKGLMSTLSKIAAIAAGADKLAGAFVSAIDANRAGVSDVPTTISEGILGGHKGGYINNLLSRGRKKQEALNYVNQQGNLGYSANNFGDLMSQYEGPLQKADINTWGNIGGAKRQDEINSAIDSVNMKRAASFDLASQNLMKNNMANFSANFHAGGGLIDNGPFSNGVTMINQGGTHENNPHEGVQMGIAPDGKPNLAEEGEAIYKDYVFSNRLKVPEEVRSKYKLRGETFADAFKWAQRESEERQNDEISKNGLDYIAMILARAQEAIREYDKANEVHMAALGGHLYATGEPDDEDLTNPYVKGSYDWTFWDPDEGQYKPSESLEGYVAPWSPVLDALLTKPSSAPKSNHKVTIPEAKIEDENIPEDPETQAAINAFWKNKIGDDWSDPKARYAYMHPTKGVDWRYATPIAQGFATFSDLLGWTNTPTIFNNIPPFKRSQFVPIGDYVAPYYMDTRFAANRQAQQAAAAQNAIMQSNSPGRNGALLANAYAAQIAQGDLLREAAQQQYANELQRRTFNRGTNQYNSEGRFKESIANQDSLLKYAQAALHQAQLQDQAETLAYMGRAENLKSFTDSLGEITRDNTAMKFKNDIVRSGALGTVPKWFGIFANGGKIRKRKKGLTY